MWKKNKPQLGVTVALQVFQQLTDINAIMFYVPVLFQTVGFKSDAALYSSAITGGINVLSTLVSMALVDQLGRRKLLLEGSVQKLVAQVAIGVFLGKSLKAGLLPPSTPTLQSVKCMKVEDQVVGKAEERDTTQPQWESSNMDTIEYVNKAYAGPIVEVDPVTVFRRIIAERRTSLTMARAKQQADMRSSNNPPLPCLSSLAANGQTQACEGHYQIS
ncbi:hypothetical protein GOP47_0021384 [Adiantum capillus-veneris]|uniref:Major facilitator superfamily (MFS) profile domain-containing protein n=1 Tax=Adiantum capillus-veneris TaxID=13818 RepID=A0A9D4U7M3_ADICA|nr:hypothetical protein GOP47_0021384 [Adiantum capillus-veneris]